MGGFYISGEVQDSSLGCCKKILELLPIDFLKFKEIKKIYSQMFNMTLIPSPSLDPHTRWSHFTYTA